MLYIFFIKYPEDININEFIEWFADKCLLNEPDGVYFMIFMKYFSSLLGTRINILNFITLGEMVFKTVPQHLDFDEQTSKILDKILSKYLNIILMIKNEEKIDAMKDSTF